MSGFRSVWVLHVSCCGLPDELSLPFVWKSKVNLSRMVVRLNSGNPIRMCTAQCSMQCPKSTQTPFTTHPGFVIFPVTDGRPKLWSAKTQQKCMGQW